MRVETAMLCVGVVGTISVFVIFCIVAPPFWHQLQQTVLVIGIGAALALLTWLGCSLWLSLRVLAGPSAERRRRLQLFETDLGRSAGWVAERDGRPVAVLSGACRGEMFWHWYTVEVTAPDTAERGALLSSPEAWVGVRFRSQLTGELCPHGFVAGPPGPDGRLAARGLYFPLSGPWIIEAVQLWWRRRRARRAEPSAAPGRPASGD
jgi:hypothetical protein